MTIHALTTIGQRASGRIARSLSTCPPKPVRVTGSANSSATCAAFTSLPKSRTFFASSLAQLGVLFFSGYATLPAALKAAPRSALIARRTRVVGRDVAHTSKRPNCSGICSARASGYLRKLLAIMVFPFRCTGPLDSEPDNCCLLPVQAGLACTVPLSSSPCHERCRDWVAEGGGFVNRRFMDSPRSNPKRHRRGPGLALAEEAKKSGERCWALPLTGNGRRAASA